jgi:hypothetical protein
MPRPKSAPKVRAAQPSPTPAPTPRPPEIIRRDDEVLCTIDTRQYRVRGLEKNLSPHQLRVNLLAQRDGLVHLDTLDLYKAKSRASFIHAAATELFIEEAVIKRDVGRLLLALEQLREAQIAAAQRADQPPVELTPAQREDALSLLADPQLTARILADYDHCGLVGEETNKLICYLACVSRLLERPLALLIQSSSAAGKTSLMDATLRLMPDEVFIRYSAMTGQSLYYMGRTSLKHKILAMAEEEGVAQASYALKLLQSDGQLRIAAAGRNAGTGRQQTETHVVEGPVMMFLTTTAEQPDLELQNRCLTMQVNESPEQTAAIHARQRQAYAASALADTETNQQIIVRHHHAQRLLQALPVVIPWAEALSFRHDQTRMRRDHAKYLTLIAASALLHQYQRPRARGTEVESIEATLDDVRLANRLTSQVIGQSLTELLPQTRQLLALVDHHVSQRAHTENIPRTMLRFTQRELRETFGWGDFQLRRHLRRLLELEYILAYRTGARNQRAYQLLYDGQGRTGEPFVMGLTEPDQLASPPTREGRGEAEHPRRA